jgi:cold shock CspA family protein
MFGKCLKFHRESGYGFILSTDDPTLPDIFVHFSDIQKTQVWNRRFLLPGFKVEFDLEMENGGDERAFARNVRVIPPLTVARQTSGAAKITVPDANGNKAVGGE